jgi:hypothetical protein
MPPNDPSAGELAATNGDERKPYEPPTLVVYGSVEKITKAVGLTGSDGLTGSALP